VSTVSRAARRVANNVCVLSGYTKHNFQLGEIITIPLHQPDLNPHADPNDQCLAHTIQGPVYSKRRMVVVLWIYEEILFCVPLYTFGKRGISSRPHWLIPEYVSVKNVNQQDPSTRETTSLLRLKLGTRASRPVLSTSPAPYQ